MKKSCKGCDDPMCWCQIRPLDPEHFDDFLREIVAAVEKASK